MNERHVPVGVVYQNSYYFITRIVAFDNYFYSKNR